MEYVCYMFLQTYSSTFLEYCLGEASSDTENIRYVYSLLQRTDQNSFKKIRIYFALKSLVTVDARFPFLVMVIVLLQVLTGYLPLTDPQIQN